MSITLTGSQVVDAFTRADDTPPVSELLEVLGTDRITVFPVRGRDPCPATRIETSDLSLMGLHPVRCGRIRVSEPPGEHCVWS